MTKTAGGNTRRTAKSRRATAKREPGKTPKESPGITPKITHRQRVEKREQAITRAAHEIFVEHGYEGARMAAIARRAGVAEGTVYLYFESKQALLDAVLAEFYEALTRGAAQGVEKIPDTFERLDFLARHHLVKCLESWRIFALTAHNSRYSEEYRRSPVYGLNRDYVTVFDRVVREGIARDDIRDDLSMPTLRDMFYGGLDYALRSALLHGEGDPADAAAKIVPGFLAVVIAGIAVPGQGGKPVTSENGALRRLERLADRLEEALAANPSGRRR